MERDSSEHNQSQESVLRHYLNCPNGRPKIHAPAPAPIVKILHTFLSYFATEVKRMSTGTFHHASKGGSRLREAKFKQDSQGSIDDNEVAFNISNRPADGSLIEFKPKIQGLSEVQFQFCIVDEAHTAKRHKGASWYALQQVKWVSLLSVTGTPITNSSRNLISQNNVFLSYWPSRYPAYLANY
ncbi:hypothetical protein FSHL1_006183 [Fusarium sambucinum]